MIEDTFWRNVADWFAYLPVRLAYRIIWLAARLNLGSARDVYAAMWGANLNLPALASADTHAKRGDAAQTAAPFMSGAVASAQPTTDAQPVAPPSNEPEHD